MDTYITDRVKIDPETGCWVWQLSLNKYGYGKAWHEKKTVTAHRLSYRLVNGDAGELSVLHRCGNRRCCNPEHLYAGTPAQNTQDAIKDGTLPKGEKHGRSRFTEDQVREIRHRRKNGETYRSIAESFGVSISAINHIVRGSAWGWL